jgi:hypothetical protein
MIERKTNDGGRPRHARLPLVGSLSVVACLQAENGLLGITHYGDASPHALLVLQRKKAILLKVDLTQK